MGRPTATPTGHEILWPDTSIIVSKTDTKGIITYANPTFQKLAGYTDEELVGQPHNLIRHPWMPRCAFKLVWDTIQTGHEVFAYVVNMARNGDHYWVFAHVTPTFGPDGTITGYHSSRRVPKRDAVELMTGLYASLCEEEAKYASAKEGMEASTKMLLDILSSKGTSYDKFILSL